jgi:uncharacterized protein YeaO (DUF488 family)
MGEAPCFAHFLDEEGNMPEPAHVMIRRVYDPSPRRHEMRVLVDRVWPRGVRKDDLHIELWAKDVAPSNELRRWFGHEPSRWDEFQRRYRYELAEKTSELKQLAELTRRGPLVLLYSARDEDHNQAVVLKEVLEEGIAHS